MLVLLNVTSLCPLSFIECKFSFPACFLLNVTTLFPFCFVGCNVSSSPLTSLTFQKFLLNVRTLFPLVLLNITSLFPLRFLLNVRPLFPSTLFPYRLCECNFSYFKVVFIKCNASISHLFY